MRVNYYPCEFSRQDLHIHETLYASVCAFECINIFEPSGVSRQYYVCIVSMLRV